MVSSSFSTFLVFLLLYVPPATIAKKRKAPSAKKKAWKDPVPCKNFYDKGEKGTFRTVRGVDYKEIWRGDTNCWYPPYEGKDIEKYGNNFYWYHSGGLWGHFLQTKVDSWFDWVQAHGPFAQNWFNCDPTAPDVENVNLEWAVKHCDGISHETGVNGWGNSYDIKPNQKTAPLDLDVNYAIRCEYPDHVAVQCLCPEKKPPEGGAQICSKRMPEYVPGILTQNGWYEWGKYNYSSPKYCTKLNMIIDRPLGAICNEHAHCAGGLQCSDGVCSACPNFECPDRTPSSKLSRWGKTCKYGEYECPNNVCIREGEGCSPTNLGLGCCTGLKCSGGMCIEDDCKVDGECTKDDEDICHGYFCFNDKVVNGEGRECYSDNNGIALIVPFLERFVMLSQTLATDRMTSRELFITL